MPLSPRAVAMLRELPRRRRWVIDRMDGTAATTNLPANDRHILAYLKTVLAKLGLEGTNHKFRHSFCTIAVLSTAYERQSLIVTTNLPFEQWTEVLGSERLTGAALDRLTHRCHILEAKGESFRLRDARRRQRRASGPS
ncbi:MAG: ATP-binding protein [Planctomycetia bacterium]